MPANMQIKNLSTSDLFTRLKKLASLERRIGVEILECLRELDRRKAYADLGYDGLYTYCVKELGFTESQAYQRIQAMRAVTELPELKPKIESGELTVSAVSKVQTHLRQEKKMGVKREAADKLALFQTVENCSSREVDVKLAEERGEKIKTRLSLELDEELEALWEQVKNLSAHRTQGSPEAILRLLAQEWLKRNDPNREVRTSQKVKSDQDNAGSTPGLPSLSPAARNRKSEASPMRERQRTVSWSTWIKGPHSKTSDHLNTSAQASASPPQYALKTVSKNRPHVPAGLRREIWRRDGAQCTQCRSRFALEADHRVPVAAGGPTTAGNLRLLCRSCNQRAGIRIFGLEKMRRSPK